MFADCWKFSAAQGRHGKPARAQDHPDGGNNTWHGGWVCVPYCLSGYFIVTRVIDFDVCGLNWWCCCCCWGHAVQSVHIAVRVALWLLPGWLVTRVNCGHTAGRITPVGQFTFWISLSKAGLTIVPNVPWHRAPRGPRSTKKCLFYWHTRTSCAFLYA